MSTFYRGISSIDVMETFFLKKDIAQRTAFLNVSCSFGVVNKTTKTKEDDMMMMIYQGR